MEKWSADYEVLLSTEKTASLVVSLDPRETAGKASTGLNFLGTPIQNNKDIKHLGVHLDTQMSFKKHASEIAKKINKRTQILQALAGKDWGILAIDLSQLYKAYAKPGGLYDLEVWGPFLSKTELQTLETANNRAARLITGTPPGTPSAAAVIEANLTPIRMEVEETAALLLDRYSRFPDDYHLKELTAPGPRPRLKSRGEDSHRLDWRSYATLHRLRTYRARFLR